MPADGAFSVTRDVYARIHERLPLFGFDYEGYWRDVGTPESLDRARRDVHARRFSPSYLRS
jgi:NDP-sugar pyrophosphorylase family protein